MQGPSITYVDQPGNRGVAYVALIETSILLYISGMKEHGLVQLDIYSCKIDLDVVIEHVNDYFDVVNMQYKFLDRTSDMRIIKNI